ncbi:MAG: SRPBCC family protein, partial [Pseudomonadota bacterium]
PAFAQTAPVPPPPLAVPAPTYVSVVQEVTINRPAADVWARIGKYCDITEWLGPPCVITAGVEGELGAVRTLNGTTVEILVAKTPLSYTYTQPARVGAPYNLYHGTLEARPVTAKTSKLVYSLIWDNSMLPDDAAREKDKTGRATRFMAALEKMKTIVESKMARR